MQLLPASCTLKGANRETENNIIEYSLYPLPAHDVQHLLSATLVETSPGVTIPNVRLDIERRGREAGVGLLSERRQGLVVPKSGEEGPHGVDKRSSVPERHWKRTTVERGFQENVEARSHA